MSMSKLDSVLMPMCIELGFDFQQTSKTDHDAEHDNHATVASNNKLTLTKWLSKNVKSKLPLGPSHQIGVGALTFHPNDSSKMLVVQKKVRSSCCKTIVENAYGINRSTRRHC